MRTDEKESTAKPSRFRVGRLAGPVALILAASVLLVPSASALGFGGFGSGAGQTERPAGVAVDTAQGRVYVADAGNNRVDVFTTGGEFRLAFGWGVADGSTTALQTCGPDATPPTATCFKGVAGSGSGQLSSPTHIAVDNDPASAGLGDIYVSDASPGVQKFDPAGGFLLRLGASELNGQDQLTVGPGGIIYVGDEGSGSTHQVKKFKADGTPVGVSTLPGTGSIRGIAVNSTGAIYVHRGGGENVIEKLEASEPNATLIESFDEGDVAENTRGITVDSEDHLFAAQLEKLSSGDRRVISEREPTGTVIKRFGYGEIQFNLNGIAIDAVGDVFGSEEYAGPPTTLGNQVIRVSQPPAGPLPCCGEVVRGNTKATIKGSVNPEGKAATLHFEFISDEDFKADSEEFGVGTVRTPESAPVGSDFTFHPAETTIGCATPTNPPQASCLKPATLYHYRLVTKSVDGENDIEDSFTTRPPVEITDTYATEVGINTAHLNSSVNPLGVAANAFFEIVDDASFQVDLAKGAGHDGFAEAAKVPATAIDLGEGESPETASTEATGLAAGTTYHYRVVVTDSFGEEAGPGQTFGTFPALGQPSNSCPNAAFRTGPSANLPDCRAYEMVSPGNKNGGNIRTLRNLGGHPARHEQSSADGASFSYSSVTSFGDAVSAPWTSQYMATRQESVGWSTQPISPPRESKTLLGGSFYTFDVQFKAFSEDLSQGWLLQDTDPPLDGCAPAGFAALYRRDAASGAFEALTSTKPTNTKGIPTSYIPELQGLSADGTHAVFRANGKLTPNAANNENYQLYEHVEGEEGCGQLRLVSVLPNGKAATTESSAGSGGEFYPGSSQATTVTHAVSSDGTRVIWTTENLFGDNVGALYIRLHADQEQSKVAGGTCTEPAQACTLQIAPAQASFWAASVDSSKVIYSVGKDLYEFDLAKALAGEPASVLIAAGVMGVAGSSEDASRIYFVSKEELNGEGVAGKPNLYLRDSGKAIKFIATLFAGETQLDNGDLNGSTHFPFSVATRYPIAHGVRITADGDHFAFVSAARLTSYDNTDAANGRPAIEVYLYDTASDQVHCVSCNPSGSRPMGREIVDSKVQKYGVSAQMAPAVNEIFVPRSLSADGSRLFFESYESLLPRDTNATEDVYEWERSSSQKECEEHGAELFVSSAAGCLSLISSGKGSDDSEFADATPDGSNVFIGTGESLLPQDTGQVDIYDVREGGGFPAPAQIVPCDPSGESCQPRLSAPVSPDPATTTPGSGNPKPSPCQKGKHQARKKHGKRRCSKPKPGKAMKKHHTSRKVTR